MTNTVCLWTSGLHQGHARKHFKNSECEEQDQKVFKVYSTPL